MFTFTVLHGSNQKPIIKYDMDLLASPNLNWSPRDTHTHTHLYMPVH